MSTSETLFLLLCLLNTISPSSSASSSTSSSPLQPKQSCQISRCTADSLAVRFPFRLAGHQPRNCGYSPGFNLGCNQQSLTTLQLPPSGEFLVDSINYLTRQIWINDPDNCLPKRLLAFDLSGSPFSAAFVKNYTFLSCSAQLLSSRNYSSKIGCLSNSTTTVLASSSAAFIDSMTSTSSSCVVFATVKVPVSWPVQLSEGSSTALHDDLMLVWDSPDCVDCESRRGFCRFRDNATREIGCLGNSNSSQLDAGLKVFKVICLSLAIPAAACAFGIACFAFFIHNSRGRGQAINNISPTAAVTPEPAATVVTMSGLDESTIESYEKVVLGESKRVPGPNDTACAICLAEYCGKETIRLIPECKHCFHADCIDEWLRMNTTCPVCRNCPSPSPNITSLS
ncbi:RING-H2 finger protein ATL22 [Linum perenne]